MNRPCWDDLSQMPNAKKVYDEADFPELDNVTQGRGGEKNKRAGPDRPGLDRPFGSCPEFPNGQHVSFDKALANMQLEHPLCWKLTPTQFQQMTGMIKAETRKVYDAVGSLELDSVTFDNTLKALANIKAEYTVQKNILIFPTFVDPMQAEYTVQKNIVICPMAPSQSEMRTASQSEMRIASQKAFKELIEFEDDMNMRKDVYQRIVALGMKVDEDSLTTEEKRYMQRLLGESIKEIQDKMKRVEVDAHRLTTEAYIDTYMETNMEARRRALHLPEEKQNEIKCINSRINNINNALSIERWVQLRAQKSALLGFKNADFAMPAMPLQAKSANMVSMFLDELAHKQKPNTIPDLSTREILDVELRVYFPVDIVTQGLLDICQDLLGLTFNLLHGAPVWHPDVTLYSVTDSSSGQIVGQFYLDLFVRDGKCSPCAYPLQPSCLLPDGSRQIAVAACVTNFRRSSTDSPYLLEHYDVIIFFHEFGHVMHILCAQTDYAIFSPGFDCMYSDYCVKWDFSEVPSMMLENWAWEKEPLQRISKHYKTGAPIPDELLDKLIKSRFTVHTKNNCLTTSQNIFLAKFEQALHTQTGLVVTPRLVYERLTTEFLRDHGYETADIPTYDAIRYNTTQIQCYRYLWSEVFSMDMFHTRFKQEGIMNHKVGLDYRNCILKPGCSKDPYEMLKNFLGREPNTEAFFLSKKVHSTWSGHSTSSSQRLAHLTQTQTHDSDEEWDYGRALIPDTDSDEEWDYGRALIPDMENLFWEKDRGKKKLIWSSEQSRTVVYEA